MKKLGLAAMLLGATTLGLTSCEFVDRTSGSPRVTTFHRDANLYKLNARLDRDKDNIACEKR